MDNIFDQEPDMDSNMEVEHGDIVGDTQLVDYDESADDGQIPYMPLLNKQQPRLEHSEQPAEKPEKVDPKMYFQKPVNPVDRMKSGSGSAVDKTKSVRDLMSTLNNMGAMDKPANQEVKTISDVVECLEAAVENLTKIDWLPNGKDHLAPKLKKAAGPIVDALRSYAKYLKTME